MRSTNIFNKLKNEGLTVPVKNLCFNVKGLKSLRHRDLYLYLFPSSLPETDSISLKDRFTDYECVGGKKTESRRSVLYSNFKRRRLMK